MERNKKTPETPGWSKTNPAPILRGPVVSERALTGAERRDLRALGWTVPNNARVIRSWEASRGFVDGGDGPFVSMPGAA